MLLVKQIIKNNIWINSNKVIIIDGNATPGEKIEKDGNVFLVVGVLKWFI